MAGLVYGSLADLPEGVRLQATAKILEQQKQKKAQMELPKGRKSKYHAEPTFVNGIRFASKREARRYEYLMAAMEAGIIADLRLQEEFTLQPAFTTPEGKRIRAIRYNADFTYKIVPGKHPMPAIWETEDIVFWSTEPTDKRIIEDSKGYQTDKYKMKRKMMEAAGFHIREV